MKTQYDIEGGNFSKAGFASSEVKRMLKQLNLDIKLIKRVVVAMYEGEVNIVVHAYHGTAEVDVSEKRIRILFTDRGPGIKDIDQAMQAGFSTATEKIREMGFGAGMGLPNIKAHADELNISSTPGKGTQVEIICYIKKDHQNT